MELKLIDILTQKEVSKRKISDIFVIKDIRFDIIKSVILWQQNKARCGNHKTKTISEISGTTAKPFKQKALVTLGRVVEGQLNLEVVLLYLVQL